MKRTINQLKRHRKDATDRLMDVNCNKKIHRIYLIVHRLICSVAMVKDMNKKEIIENYKFNTEYILNNKLSEKLLRDAKIYTYSDEIFVKVKCYKDYYISSFGRLISRKNGKLRLLAAIPSKACGYISYKLSKPRRTYNGKIVKGSSIIESITAQRLVAETFCCNHFADRIDEKLETHHIDGNITNNYYRNLLLLPKDLHNIINRIQKLALWMNERWYRLDNPEDIAALTGLSIEEIIQAYREGEPVECAGKYMAYEYQNIVIGYIWKSSKKRKIKKKKNK